MRDKGHRPDTSEIPDRFGIKITRSGGLALFHNVECLGAKVAERVAALIKTYAARTSVQKLPPITLAGAGWDRTWEELAALEGFRGAAGPSFEESRHGISYQCLELTLPSGFPRDFSDEPAPRTLEGAIAHEMTHLRWRNLRHGPEFDARVRALLRGAEFPRGSAWSRRTKEIVAEERAEVARWFERLLARSGK